MLLFPEKLCRNERTKFVLIKDALNTSGKNLLRSIAKLFIKEGAHICLVNCDILYDDWMNKLHIPIESFQLHEFFTDLYGCDSCEKKDIETFTCIGNAAADVIIIDSLSSLIYRFSFEKVYSFIKNQLSDSSSSVQIVALLHADAHDIKTSAWLERLASSVITTVEHPQCENQVFSFSFHDGLGKYFSQTLQYQMNDGLDMKVVKGDPPSLVKEDIVLKDPTVDLPFNLSLKGCERDERNKLLLPYIKDQNKMFLSSTSAIFRMKIQMMIWISKAG